MRRSSPSSSLLLPRTRTILRECSGGGGGAITRFSKGAAAAVASMIDDDPPFSIVGRRLYYLTGHRGEDHRHRHHRLRRGRDCFRGPRSPAVFTHHSSTTGNSAGLASTCPFHHQKQLRHLSTLGGGDDDEEDGTTTTNTMKKLPGGGDRASRGPLATLRVHGPDRRGIVASFSNLLYSRGCSIVDGASERSVDTETGADLFFQRILFDYGGCSIPEGEGGQTEEESCRVGIEADIRNACEELGMHGDLDWDYGCDEGNQTSFTDDKGSNTTTTVSSSGGSNRSKNGRKRVAIMVSRYDHCLWELLLRHRAGELPNCDVVAVLSNHPDLRHVADTFSVPYHVFPIPINGSGSSSSSVDDDDSSRAEVERRELDLLLNVYDVDVVVLARYMQVLSGEFCSTFPNRIINIHHSFLPAFKGGRPYHRAHERGVKLIGATAHYATVDLDEGPIIEQDIARISHRDTVKDLIRKGRTLEKTVLVHALRAHLEDRIIVYKNRCIVFGE